MATVSSWSVGGVEGGGDGGHVVERPSLGSLDPLDPDASGDGGRVERTLGGGADDPTEPLGAHLHGRVTSEHPAQGSQRGGVELVVDLRGQLLAGGGGRGPRARAAALSA